MVKAFFGPGGPACTVAGGHRNCGAPKGDDVLVRLLSPSQWRLVDRRFPENDACSLLGFIEEKNHQFEVMQLAHGFHWFTFPSLGEAFDHFREPAEGAGAQDLSPSLPGPLDAGYRSLVSR
jgi:hypothetical protein